MIPLDLKDLSDMSPDTDDVLCQLSLMCQQEDRWYTKHDYILEAQKYQQNRNDSQTFHQMELDIDEKARIQMMMWCYQVTDFCGFNHNTVEVAMNYTDRFMMTPQGKNALYDRNLYQLICMTALYTISKVHESKCMSPQILCALSRGLYTEEQFVSMESVMIQAVRWKLNSPTTSTFIDLLLKLIPTSLMPIGHRELIHSHATKLAESLLCNETLLSTKSSVIAYCALMRVLDELSITNGIMAIQLALSVGISSLTEEIMVIQKNLYGYSDRMSPESQKERSFSPGRSFPTLLETESMSLCCLSPTQVSEILL